MKPYVKLDNVYFVPVLRQRLAFAVLVRKAFFAQPGWNARDLIAVAFPESLGEALRFAIGRRTGDLMPVSLIISSWAQEEHHEVTPVTPADGLVEAVRLAHERNLPLALIDQEVKPGHLFFRSCLRDPDWPDDDIVLRLGIEQYLKAISHLIEQPPLRFEPIDTWREEHMAERLRLLSPRFRRVLVVCEATHLNGILKRLRRPSRQFTASSEAPGPAFKPRVVRPSPDVLLRALDDFPRIVEIYERFRAAPGRRDEEQARFDKWEALFRCLQEGLNNEISTRKLLSFRQFVFDLLARTQRFSPRLAEIQEACQGCLGRQIAERVLAYLGGYGRQIEVERLRINPQQNKVTLQERYETPHPETRHLQRFCIPQPPQYSAELPPYRPPGMTGASQVLELKVIGPDPLFTLRIRKKLAAQAVFQKKPRRSMPFMGSMQGGLDIRRTLRSHFAGRPALFVKEWTRRTHPSDLLKEPIVWLFNLPQQGDGVHLSCVLQKDPLEQEKRYVKYSEAGGENRSVYVANDGLLEIYERRLYGCLSYHDYLSTAEAMREFGSSFPRRVPEHQRHHGIVEPAGCVHQRFHPHVQEGSPWWDVLLLSGIHHAEKAVIYVVPEGFRLSNPVRAFARSRGVDLVCFNLSYFSQDEVRRLAVAHSAKFPPQLEADLRFRERLFSVMDKLGIWRERSG